MLCILKVPGFDSLPKAAALDRDYNYLQKLRLIPQKPKQIASLTILQANDEVFRILNVLGLDSLLRGRGS
jgi:hypothetical protein